MMVQGHSEYFSFIGVAECQRAFSSCQAVHIGVTECQRALSNCQAIQTAVTKACTTKQEFRFTEKRLRVVLHL